ncbi:MAG: YceI family protein [Cyclobacteriaceae bacterium]
MSVSNWVVDPAHSYIEFTLHINGDVSRRVYFRKIASLLKLEESFENSELQLQWVSDSVDSGDKGLDKFLTSADFFAADKVPTLKFTSEKISKLSETQFGIRGTLNYGHHDEPISFNTRFENNLINQEDGRKRTGLYMSTQVEPGMFGIKNREIRFDKSIGIEVELEFLEKV